jgi:hypothetical protein
MCIPPKNSFASLVCRRGELPVGGANSNSKAEVAVEVVIDFGKKKQELGHRVRAGSAAFSRESEREGE